MKITIYELLGKVKDKVDIDTYIRYYDKLDNKIDVMLACKENIIYNLDRTSIELNDEVEILEEEKKIPEKINNGYIKQAIEDMKEARFNSNDMAKICNRIGWLMENRNELSNKIDEIIDYLDYLKSKGDE